ncbi:MAG: ABC transporter permease [Elainella sp. C42_A2020_010]|nr:ABC transporter permease [Elainella sp. C42_A2020_010]
MNAKLHRHGILPLLAFLTTLLFLAVTATPGQAHWADMSAAEMVVEPSTVQITLTYPTGLTPFADTNQDGQLSPDEVRASKQPLTTFLENAIRLRNQNNQAGVLQISPPLEAALPPTVRAAPNTHSTIRLTYAWNQPLQALKIHYNLFLPGVPTANCLATILQNHQLRTVVFTPKNQDLTLSAGLTHLTTGGLLLTIAGAIVWGAMHSLSPGHGKTLVGAYLVGTRSTPKHAILLAATTTITHTLGIFALGFVALFASRYILPERLYPWMNLLSGVMVIAIGLRLFIQRLSNRYSSHRQAHRHSHSHRRQPSISGELVPLPAASLPGTGNLDVNQPHWHNSDSRHHQHQHSHHQQNSHHPPHHHSDHSLHDHIHHHSHDHHHPHTHLPLGPDDTPVTWRNLVALGISGGLTPCPAALVLLLSCMALGQVGLGLILVLAFSLGLAGVLTGLGLLMVYAKTLFQRLPVPKRPVKLLPALSALGIVLIGVGLSAQAVMEIAGG